MKLSPRILGLLSAAAPVALIAAAPVVLAHPVAHTAERNVTTQLPRNAVPSHYAIRIKTDAPALTFTGSVAITVAVTEATQSLTLNAADLTFKTVTIADADGKKLTGSVALNEDVQTATLTFPAQLKPGSYTLAIDYAGIINTQANGLFALDYTDTAGAAKRALFTQMEAPDARRFVPSWDEPSYKATFDLSAVIPAGEMSVGNMPIVADRDLGNGKREVTFATTPKMSSYLLFFSQGELERATMMAGETEVGVVTGKGNVAKAQFALEASAELLPWFNDYFGVKYPLPKLDNVAGPGQSQFFGAMENWGAIFTFERALLVDPSFTSEGRRRRIYETVAHEMAHQWFGNIVTMAWWDDLWLNEGFASWMATKITDHFKPEWQMLLTRVDGRESAMGLDSLATTHPVIQKVETVEQLGQAFDAITYQKGEAVITMLEAYAGEDVWQRGIQSYMAKHAYGNTVTSDLWQAVEDAGAKGLVTIAQDFTTKPGIPLITVQSATCVGGMLELNLMQGEFSRDNPGKAPLAWNVPVIVQTLGQAPVRSVLSGGQGKVTAPGCGAYVINAGQTGYYRSLYPESNVNALAKNFGKLDAIDQLGLLADNWQLAQGGYQPFERALNLVDTVPADASNVVLSSVAGYASTPFVLLGGDQNAQAKASAWAQSRLLPVLARIGFDPVAGEDAQVPILRQSVVSALGEIGSKTVVDEANRRFAALDSNPAALDGPLKTIWLSIVAGNADQATWDKLRALANKTTTSVEKSQYFGLLGAAKDAKLAEQALKLALTDEPGKTTSADIISTVSGEHPEMAVDFALANLAQYETLIDASARSRAVAGLGSSSADPAMIQKLEGYAAANLTPQSRSAIDQAIAIVKTRIETRARLKPQLTAWLAKR